MCWEAACDLAGTCLGKQAVSEQNPLLPGRKGRGCWAPTDLQGIRWQTATPALRNLLGLLVQDT